MARRGSALHAEECGKKAESALVGIFLRPVSGSEATRQSAVVGNLPAGECERVAPAGSRRSLHLRFRLLERGGIALRRVRILGYLPDRFLEARFGQTVFRQKFGRVLRMVLDLSTELAELLRRHVGRRRGGCLIIRGRRRGAGVLLLLAATDQSDREDERCYERGFHQSPFPLSLPLPFSL